MAMNSNAHAYQQQEQAYEVRKVKVLDGRKAWLREHAKRAGRVKVVIAVSAVFLYFIGLTFMTAQICSSAVQLNTIKATIAETENMTARAELELGNLSSLERIEAYAIAELGMVYPGSDGVYFLDEQSSAVLAQANQQSTAAGADTTGVEADTADASWWQSIKNGIQGLFANSAQAAEN